MINNKNQGICGFFFTITTILLLTISNKIVYAGNGTFSGGDHNFCVSVRFNASAADLTKIKTAFQNGSQILADATDGQHKFGTVTIVNDSGASQSSEYWVNPGTGRAYATLGKYGMRGEHVMMYINSDFQASNGSNGDAYTVAHEHAHHSYGVADEYSGPSGSAEDAPTPDTATLSYSLMDNYFTRGGRAFGSTNSDYTLNEFCVASNHDPDMDTHQDDIHGKSVWEIIAAHPKRSATAPVGLPVDAPPALHNVTFKDGIAGLSVMMLLDRSGSMSIQQRLDFAKLGANQFVNTLDVGDSIGVASFSSSASTNFSLTPVIDNSTKVAAQAAINSLNAGGLTNIGGGLQTALGQITSQADRSCNEIIILLSDGDHNTGTAPGAVIPQLQSEGVTILTVGVGTGISTSGQAALLNIATQTGGKYFSVANSFDLIGLFLQIAAESLGSGILTRSPEAIISNETKDFPVLVEAGSTKATFAVVFQTGDDVTVSLVKPSGDVINMANAAANSATYNLGPNSQVVEVILPDSGLWNIRVEAGTISHGALDIVAFGDNDGTQLNAAILNSQPIAFPEAITINATPRFAGESVVGAHIEGHVTRPDGSTVHVDLFDDGLGGDDIPDDGTYTALFSQYNEDGTYVFDLQSNTNGSATTFAGEELFLSQPSNELPVPTFTRQTSIAAVVTGVPQFIQGTVEYGPETINLHARGRFVTAYIELPTGMDPSDIDVSSVKLTAIDGSAITPLHALEKPTSIGDVDNDGIDDLMVKFDRQLLHSVLTVGMHAIHLEGMVDGQVFKANRSVGVIDPVNK